MQAAGDRLAGAAQIPETYYHSAQLAQAPLLACRAGQLAKAIHVLQTRKSEDEKGSPMRS